jgi:Holliday junction resolvase-like predicted endonuclease
MAPARHDVGEIDLLVHGKNLSQFVNCGNQR